MATTISLDLHEVNEPNTAVQFTRAQRIAGSRSPLIMVHYEENGKQPSPPYGLRLDLDKRVFLDYLTNPEYDAIAQSVVLRIVDTIIKYRFFA